MRRIAFIAAILALATAACLCTGGAPPPTLEPSQPTEPLPTPQQSPPGTPPEGLTPDQIEGISRAAVQIAAAQQTAGGLEPIWTGSGTIISPTGEILTNCHVACGAPVLVILMTTDPDQPPEPSFIAEVTHYNEELDLALIQVRTDMNGNPVSPTDLPFLEIGDSDSLRLGDRVYIFGYPGVGGDTITFTTGSVSGFESATVNGVNQRVVIKTDADIAGGNSGGTAVDLYGRLVAVPTAVNPDVRQGVTLGGIGMLTPVNLVSVVRQTAGAPPVSSASLPPANEPDPYEPNDQLHTASGPIPSGERIIAYISWDQDVDIYFINPRTTQPINISLQGPSGTDYDLYLVDSGENIVGSSESTTSQESINYNPPATGTYYIAVISYSGASTVESYALTITYDGGAGSAGGTGSGGIQITGQMVDGATRQPLAGGVFGILQPGVTCSRFFASSQLDLSLVVASAETNNAGVFTLTGVPRGATYTAFFLYGSQTPVCEDSWLEVPVDAVDSDLGVIEVSTN